jgi:ribosomal protein S6--L-glutamate ligase
VTIYTSWDIKARYQELGAGDIVVGEVASAHQNSVILIDLMQRGVRCIPSPLAQLLSRSKVAQVDILGQYMLPLTLAVKRRKDLLNAIGTYAKAGIRAVVTKEEHMHCGHGVRKWDHIETVYSFRGLEKEGYPFVLQPLATDFTDVRVIMVGEDVEAYTRTNTDNFRGNLSAGGQYALHELTPEQMRFCRKIVDRAQFPYAHLDLLIMPDGQLHIFEIALDGGICGSRWERSDLDRHKAEWLNQLAQEMSARPSQQGQV